MKKIFGIVLALGVALMGVAQQAHATVATAVTITATWGFISGGFKALTTATDTLVPAATGELNFANAGTIPADAFYTAGQVYTVVLGGTLTSIVSDTLTIGLRTDTLAGTLLGSSALVCGLAGTLQPWCARVTLMAQAVGTSGRLVCGGMSILGGVVAPATFIAATGPGTGAWGASTPLIAYTTGSSHNLVPTVNFGTGSSTTINLQYAYLFPN